MEKILQNKELLLNFLSRSTELGLVNQDLYELDNAIKKDLSILNDIKKDLIFDEVKQMADKELKNLIELHNKNINELIIRLENNIVDYKYLVKDRYLEFGAVLFEIESEYIND